MDVFFPSAHVISYGPGVTTSPPSPVSVPATGAEPVLLEPAASSLPPTPPPDCSCPPPRLTVTPPTVHAAALRVAITRTARNFIGVLGAARVDWCLIRQDVPFRRA